MVRELLRQLPGVDAWVSSEQGATLAAEYSREEVVEVMRAHLARIRNSLENGGSELPDFTGEDYTNRLRADLLARRTGSLRPVINATGIVIHTNIGRAPLAPEAIRAVQEVAAGYSNLEYDLASGERGSRNAHVSRLLAELTGAEAALVVNNCAAAVLLGLRALAAPGEVVVSRGELIEIGGSFRMPDVIAESGARMVEVGTTNRTTIRDFALAVTEHTRVLLASHPSNYRIVGFTAAPGIGDLSRLARDRGLVLIQDLGSGSLCPLEAFGDAEPTVADCIAAGADIVTFSGDKLLGGPQAGIVVGRAELIARLGQHPLARAMRIDKLSLAALTATLRLYRAPNDPRAKVPVLRMLAARPDEIAARAGELAAQLAAIPGSRVALADGVGYAGGGALPMAAIPTCLVRLEAEGMAPDALARRLRAAARPVVARIVDGAVVLDPRTVLPGQMQELVESVRQALS